MNRLIVMVAVTMFIAIGIGIALADIEPRKDLYVCQKEKGTNPRLVADLSECRADEVGVVWTAFAESIAMGDETSYYAHSDGTYSARCRVKDENEKIVEFERDPSFLVIECPFGDTMLGKFVTDPLGARGECYIINPPGDYKTYRYPHVVISCKMSDTLRAPGKVNKP